MIKIPFILVSLFVCTTLFAQAQKGINAGENETDSATKKNPAMAPVEDTPGLPRVLLIGDSISIGYTLKVRELLKDKANVHRVPRNCGSSRTGVSGTKQKEKWLLDQPWDVIHYNFGIWDSKLKEKTGKVTTSDEVYIKNLIEITENLKQTNAELIFATTTPIPDNLLIPEEPGEPMPKGTRVFLDVQQKNKLAVETLEPMGVEIDDLYAEIYPVREQHWRPNDLHFTPEGSEVLAEAVAASISIVLEKRQAAQP